MNPRRRRHQRIRRKALRRAAAELCWCNLLGCKRRHLDGYMAIPPGVRIELGRVRSVDPVTGIAEIEMHVTPAGTVPLISTVVQLEQTFGEGAPLVRELKP